MRIRPARSGFTNHVELLLMIAWIGCSIGLSVPATHALSESGYSRWIFLIVFPVCLAVTAAYYVGLPLASAWIITFASRLFIPETESATKSSRFEDVYAWTFSIFFFAPILFIAGTWVIRLFS